MKTEKWPLRGAFLPQGRQLWEQPWPAWQDEVVKERQTNKKILLHIKCAWQGEEINRKANKQREIVTCWTHLAPLVGSVLFATPGFALDPTPGEDLQKWTWRLFLTRSAAFRRPPSKIIYPISRISCWSSFLVIFDFHCYWLSSMLLVIIIGFYCWPTQLLVIIVSSLRNHFLLFFFTNFIRLVSSMPLLSIFRGMRRDENKRKIRGCS